MSQTIIDNIDNYTFEIINGSLILTPKNNITNNSACNIIKVDKTILINDVKHIIKGVDKSFHNNNSLVITCVKENDNTTRMFCISKYQKLEVDDNNNIIFNFIFNFNLN